VPYLLVALFAFALARGAGGTRPERWHAGLAVAYGIVLLWAAGPTLLVASTLVYAPGTLLFWLARREQGRRGFTTVETVIFALLATAAVAAGIGLADRIVAL
jgi:arginine:ornithine antiporter/lysine permease